MKPENLIGENSNLHAPVGKVVEPYCRGTGGRGIANLRRLAERVAHPAQGHARDDTMRGGVPAPLRFLLRPVGGPTVVENVDTTRLHVLGARLVLVSDVARAVGALE